MVDILKNVDDYKHQAAKISLGFIQSGMVIGLGAGSTAIFALQMLSEKIKNGSLNNISGIPCSLQTEHEAIRLGIPLTTLEEHPVVDLTIDGADEVDPALNLIKGGGGALLREKIVAQASRREIIIVDESKLSNTLGTNWPVPVEVLPFGWGAQAKFLESLGANLRTRVNLDGSRYRTDQGNMILDCDFGLIQDPLRLANMMGARAGIIEHGLFVGLASDVIVVGEHGCRHLTIQNPEK